MKKNMIARYIAFPVVSAGIFVGAALGLAGMANSANPTQPSGPGYKYAPTVKADPAPEAKPGWRNHRGIWQIIALQGN